MSEVTLGSLELRLQKQVESARAAFDKGQVEQAVELCRLVLQEQPACLAVRKLERAAQLKVVAARKDAMSKLVKAVSSAPFLLGGSLILKEDPRGTLAAAEKLLRRDPQNVAALVLLGQAALALGWPETAVFAYETASDLEPDRPDILVSLGGAYLADARARDAIAAAQEALLIHPGNAEAETLLRNASVALTVKQGKWETDGDIREQMHVEKKTVPPLASVQPAEDPPPPRW